MFVRNATAFLPMACAVFTRKFASILASATDFMNAPEPYFTSKTRASEPSATFLERMLAVISGTDSTVAVTSRRA